ncbi:MAG: RNA polymerase sigma factor [Acidimicrobiales bacterium]
MNEPAPPGDGRSEAFARHVVPELDVLLRVARSMTSDLADAEDLVQDTLVCAYRGLDRFDGRYPRAWLLTILRNCHANRSRRRRPGLLRRSDDALAQMAATASSPRHDPEAVIVDDSFDAQVSAALESLSEPHRAVVALVDLAGLSYREAATALGVPVGTVMSRLHRARAKMRTRLRAAGLAPRGGQP